MRTSLSRLPRPSAATSKRWLNLHEYQSAAIMASHGVNVPPGIAATSVADAVAAAKELGGDEVVIKSQILAGGRGLGTFTNGFQGGVHVIDSAKTAEYAEKMIGETLVTKQSGAEGKPVNVVMVAEKPSICNAIAQVQTARTLTRCVPCLCGPDSARRSTRPASAPRRDSPRCRRVASYFPTKSVEPLSAGPGTQRWQA